MSDCSAVLDLVGKLSDFGDWEEEISRVVNDAGCRLSAELLAAIDDHLAATRPEGLRHLGYRSRRIVSRFGEIELRRRIYRDGDGRYRLLLDDAIGLRKRKGASPTVAALAASLAAHVPFRVAADLISRILPSSISHQAIHTLVAEIGDARAACQEKERAELFCLGVLPEARAKLKEAESLYLEADGVKISLQREAKKTAEVKVGLAYSGKREGAATDKVVHIDVQAADAFFQHLAVKLAKVFDLSSVSSFATGGDGAPWIRVAQRLFPSASFRLSRFHLKRALTGALGFSKSASQIYASAVSGDLGGAFEDLDEAARTAPPEKLEEIRRVASYLATNADGLGPGQALGAIESNVDKLAANRMKKRGMSWSLAGARRMGKLIEANFERAIDEWVGRTVLLPSRTLVPAAACRPVLGSDPAEWLRAHLAPVDGPHASRPWAKVLREISRGSPYMTGIVPTKR